MTGDTNQSDAISKLPLDPGRYQLTATLTVRLPDAAGAAGKFEEHSFDEQWVFTVSGSPPVKVESQSADIRAYKIPSLQPDIAACFPPDGNQGDYSDMLPQIVLKRPTLPWEYRATAADPKLPWLALLLFDEDQAPALKTVTVAELASKPSITAAGAGVFPAFDASEKGETLVKVIDVPAGLLGEILPPGDDLKRLAQVRLGENGSSFAVIACSRVPRKGATSEVHLVSLEGRYDATGEFNYQKDEDIDLVRLISLANWRFACISEEQKFTGRLRKVQSDTLRLPASRSRGAVDDQIAALGLAAVQYLLPDGEPTTALYRGPLLPGQLSSPPRTWGLDNAGRLRGANRGSGTEDLTLASAWELGRFLALESKAFCADLYQWKWAYAQRKHSTSSEAQQAAAWESLLLDEPAAATEPPASVKAWFEEVQRLQGIPFNYLVPDKSLLPEESIRFFYLDTQWLEALQDGAFSVGRVGESDLELRKRVPAPAQNIAGFLLRSQVVADWPGMLVQSPDAQTYAGPTPIARDTLLCLFRGRPKQIDLLLRPEMAALQLRGAGIWRGDASRRVLDITGLVDKPADEGLKQSTESFRIEP